MFYTGDKFPEWKGNYFVGGLAGNKTLYRLVLNSANNAIVGQEPFFAGQHEIRDLKQGPDGWIYMEILPYQPHCGHSGLRGSERGG